MKMFSALAPVIWFVASTAAQSTTSASNITYTGPPVFTTTTTIVSNASHAQAPYPSPTGDTCGGWTLIDGVCCPQYCTNDNRSSGCSDDPNCNCGSPPSSMCKSGTMYGEDTSVTPDEPWHYSVRYYKTTYNLKTDHLRSEINTFRSHFRRGLWIWVVWSLHKRKQRLVMD